MIKSSMFPRVLAFWFVCALLLGFATSSANAQVLEEDKDSYVKKGFFFSIEYGPVINVLPAKTLSLGASGGAQAALLGHLGGMALGFDLGDHFNLHLSYLTTQIPGDPQYGGGTGTHIFSLAATIHFVRVSQWFIYAKLGAGLMLTMPADSVPLGLMAHAGVGFLYYTRMRHFAIGLEAMGLIGVPFPSDKTGITVGVGVMPVVHYTF